MGHHCLTSVGQDSVRSFPDRLESADLPKLIAMSAPVAAQQRTPTSVIRNEGKISQDIRDWEIAFAVLFVPVSQRVLEQAVLPHPLFLLPLVSLDCSELFLRDQVLRPVVQLVSVSVTDEEFRPLSFDHQPNDPML